MNRGYRLLTLDCPQCGAPLAAEGEDVLYYCTACYSGFRLDSKTEELKPFEVSFVALSDRVAHEYRPFWRIPATIETTRDTGGSLLSPIAQFFFGDRSTTGHDPGKGIFVVPAFATPLERATTLADRYTAAFPQLGERLGEKLLGGIYSLEDAHKLAHFTFIAGEVEKPGILRDLDYKIQFEEPSLLGVPFTRDGKSWKDLIFGLRG